MAAKKVISRIQHRRGPLNDLSGVVLNSGEVGFAVDERRVFIGNRTEEGGPIDENIELLTEYSAINVSSGGGGGGTPTLTNVSFSTLGSDTTFLTIDSTNFNVIHMLYTLDQNGIKRTGTFRIISDGSVVTYGDDYVEAGGITNVVLKAILVGINIEIQYNLTGNTADFNYTTDNFLQS